MSNNLSKKNEENTVFSSNVIQTRSKTNAEKQMLPAGSQNLEAANETHVSGNGHEATVPKGSEIRKIDKSEFFNKKTSNLITVGIDETKDSDESETEIIDESQFRNKKPYSASKIGPSNRKEPNKADSMKSLNGMSKTTSLNDFHVGGVPSRDKDESSSFVKCGLNFVDEDEDDTSSSDADIVKIDEAEFIQEKKHAVSKIVSQTKRDIVNQGEENKSVKSRENRKRKPGSVSLIGKEVDGESDNTNGIAHWTRSKIKNVKNLPELNNVFLDSSDTSISSSSDSGSDRYDEDFRVEVSSSSFVEESDVQNESKDSSTEKLSAEKQSAKGSSTEKSSAEKRSAKRRCSSNLRTEEEKSNSPGHETFKKRRRLTSDKRNAGPSEVPQQNEETNKNIEDVPNANTEEGLKEGGDGMICSDSHGQNGHNEKLTASDEIEIVGVETQKTISPSRSGNVDCGHNNDGIPTPSNSDDKPSSDSHGHNETETVCPTIKKQLPPKKYDICRILAYSILENGNIPEEREIDEEPEPEPEPQNQTSLPLKFRFEDDEETEVIEKTEFEKEMDGLFDELDFCWSLHKLGSANCQKVDKSKANATNVGATPAAQCAIGNHVFILRDDTGLRCKYCLHEELGPKDVMPMWGEKTCQSTSRKRFYQTGHHLSQFDERHLSSSSSYKDYNVADLINNGDGTIWSITPGVRETMYEHQQEGLEFLWKNLAGSIQLSELKDPDPSRVGGCIISHAPGTGKTRLSIVFLETYLKLFPDSRPVIVAPASMLLTWEEEFKKWNVPFPFHNLNNLELTGKEKKAGLRLIKGAKSHNKKIIRMIKIYSWNTGRGILGISYSLFENLVAAKKDDDKETEPIARILLEKPELVILDEGHTPRNERSNIWNVLLKLKTQKRVILSGTPFQNNFGELFNTLRLVRPAFADDLERKGSFPELTQSRRKLKGKNPQSEPTFSDSSVEKLKIAMSPFVHVHKGTILRQSLPGLRDCVVLLKPPELQRRMIEGLEGYSSTFEYQHKVALISVHPYLIKFCSSSEKQIHGIDQTAIESSKLDPNAGVKTQFIIELIRLSLALNEKVLIFSQYIQPLELIKEQIQQVFDWRGDRQILQMKGKLDQKQRQLMINKFNDPKSESKVLLASTKCCSEGISLVGASRLVLLDVVWNPSVERQAISRAYRIGQKKFVYTYHLMTRGTPEGDKYIRQAEKERLSELVFTSSSNETDNKKNHGSAAGVIEDGILEEMIGQERLNGMFEKIINQPKEANLIETFGTNH